MLILTLTLLNHKIKFNKHQKLNHNLYFDLNLNQNLNLNLNLDLNWGSAQYSTSEKFSPF